MKMSKNWNYSEDKKRIIIDPPKQRLRITGHRIASVLGLNKWQSPFGAWAEITKLVKLPFEDNKYTLAGKAIEPKLIEYVGSKLPNVVSIEDYYGNNFDKYRYNNFIDDSDRFGGIIDAVSTLNDKKTITMICECKTSSNAQYWANNEVPVDYLLQGALYSYLKGLDRVVFACTFLKEEDYNHPETFEVNDENTIIVIKKLDDMIFEVDGEYLNIEGCMQKASEWWDKYIETGISPEFDEIKDKEYLNIIRATDVTKDSELESVCQEAYELNMKIEQIKEDNNLKDLEKRLDQLKDSIKAKMVSDDISTCGKYKLTSSKRFNSKLLQEEEPALYEKYKVESYTLNIIKEKDEE